MTRRPSSELLQEAEVALEVVLDVGDAVLEHRHALEAHAEREAGVLLAVVADVAEDLRVDHAGAADLDPAGALADAARAARAGAEGALHVDLDARLDELEVARPEAQVQRRAEVAPHEVEQ